MQLYVVGGAVRDRLLGEPAQDRDWVAVGATPQQLIAAGYKPVGRDFPVFLHPSSGEEVALARTERKSAPGYRGFVVHAAPEVTLEEDLARRDLTINAMAQTEDGRLIDPFGGARDLAAGVLRHVSPAFTEDPVRLLRVARFAARWPHFTLAAETAALLQQMVSAGEVDALVSERVWQELSRGLMAARPSRMLEVLEQCGALARLLPQLDPAPSTGRAAGALAERQALDRAAGAGASLEERYALLGFADAAAAAAASARLRASGDCEALAVAFARERRGLAAAAGSPAAALALLERCDALRRPRRFASLLRCAGWQQAAQPAALAALGRAHEAALNADAAAAARGAQQAGARGPEIGAAVGQARLDAIASAWARA